MLLRRYVYLGLKRESVEDVTISSLPGQTGKRTELDFLANGSKRQTGELTLSTNSATGGQKSVTNFWIPGICGNWTSDKPRETSQDLLSLVFNVSTMQVERKS